MQGFILSTFWQGFFSIGGGPSLFSAKQAELLKQWNARVAFQLLPSLLLTLGVSARQLDLPTGRFAEGDIVAVSANDKPPTFEQKHAWAWQLSLGIAVDLATVGKLIADSATSAQKSASGGATSSQGGGK